MTHLQGTPVVPGVAHAPPSESAARSTRPPSSASATVASPTPTPRSQPMTSRPRRSPTGSPPRPPRRTAPRPRCSPRARVWPATRACARPSRSRSRVAPRSSPAVHAAVEQFVAVFTSMGGLMAERATDLRDIERRVVAHLVGEPEPGVSLPSTPVRARRRGPRTRRHCRPGPRDRARPGHREGRPDQPHRDHRPPAGHPLRGRHGRRAWRSPTARGSSSTAPQARSRPSPTPTRPTAGSPPTASSAPRWPPGQDPAAPRTAHPVKLLAERRRRRVGAQGVEQPIEGVGLFRTELCFLDRQEEPSVAEQADIYAEVLEPFGEGQYVVVRTLDAGSDKPVAFATLEGEENPALGVRGLRLVVEQPGPAGPPARRHRRGGQAHRHRDVGDGADGGDRRRGQGLRRRGAHPRPQGGRDGRDPVGGAAGPPLPRGRRLPVDRHQRPDAVRHGGRPDGLRPRAPDRPVAARRAAPDRDHGRGRQAGRQVGRGLRRGRGRPAAGVLRWSAWA